MTLAKHKTVISLLSAVPPEVDAGASLTLKVRIECASGCDLRGGLVQIVDERKAAAEKQVALAEYDGTANETGECIVNAPSQTGTHTWMVAFPAQEKQGVLHEASSTPFTFVVRPHVPSVKILDVPDPVAVGDKFQVKVGVECAAECSLADLPIAILDHAGVQVATATLGSVPLAGAPALYWAEVTVQAPGDEGRYIWLARFPKPALEVAHAEASRTFAFGVAGAAEHVVTVRAIDAETQASIKDATVLIRPVLYNGYAFDRRTDDTGEARVAVPKGIYQVYVSGNGKELFLPIVDVNGDITVKAEVQVKPEDVG